MVIIVKIISKQDHHFIKLDPASKAVLLYGDDKIYLEFDFNSTQIILDEKLKSKTYFLDKEKKNSIEGFKINYKRIPTKNVKNKQDIYSGSIGLASNNDLFAGLRKMENSNDIKLWFQMKDNIVEIIPLKCFNPIFPPYLIEVETFTKVRFDISAPSMELQPNQLLLGLFNRTHNPFQMAIDQLRRNVRLKLYDEIIDVRVEQLTEKCRRFAGMGEKYQCQLKINDKKNSNYGNLLMYFNPVICNHGIELQPTSSSTTGTSSYYYLHLLLLLFLLIAFIMMQNYERLMGFIKKETKQNKY